MQLLTYINLASQQIIFGNTPPLILATVQGTESTSVARKTLKGAMQDGERTVSMLRDNRLIDVTFSLITGDRRDLYRQRARLSEVLGPDRGFNRDTGERGRLIYQNNFGRWWTWAVPSRPPRWPRRLQDLHANIKTSFECDSPYWFSTSDNSTAFVNYSADFSMPVKFPERFGVRALEAALINYGQSNTPVKITVNGEGERLSIINRTTGARISFTTPLPKGDLLELNTDPEDLYVLITDNAGQRNAYGYLDVTTPITGFYLAPGENRIEYESGDATSRTRVSMTWLDRFEGL